jgi:non-canonical (house-cleaning) NTP pyrophosphatase
VDSGVPDQPFGDLQTLQGCDTLSLYTVSSCVSCSTGDTLGISDTRSNCRATNRAKRLAKERSDGLCVAIEGGVGDCISGSGALECFAWAVVLDPATGRKGQARSASFQLPDAVASLVRRGVELGAADDQVLGRQNSGQKSGTVGYVTFTRVQSVQHSLIAGSVVWKQGCEHPWCLSCSGHAKAHGRHIRTCAYDLSMVHDDQLLTQPCIQPL